MTIENLARVIGKTAPILGTAIGGPIGGAAGLIISGIANLFGGNVNEPDALASLIQADPDAALKLRQFEIQHQEFLYKAVLDDKASAREREKSVVQSTMHRDWVVDMLAVGTVSGFFILCILIFFIKVDPSMAGIVNFVCGEVSSMCALVLSYFFGATFKSGSSVPPFGNVTLPLPAQTK